MATLGLLNIYEDLGYGLVDGDILLWNFSTPLTYRRRIIVPVALPNLTALITEYINKQICLLIKHFLK